MLVAVLANVSFVYWLMWLRNRAVAEGRAGEGSRAGVGEKAEFLTDGRKRGGGKGDGKKGDGLWDYRFADEEKAALEARYQDVA